MTIVFATKRQTFAVLGADRMASSPDMSPRPYRKVYCHPTLPLAAAMAGQSYSKDQKVTALERGFKVTATTIYGLMADALGLLVLREQLDPRYITGTIHNGLISHLETWVTIWVVFVTDGVAAVVQVNLDRYNTTYSRNEWKPCFPPHVSPLYESDCTLQARFNDTNVNSPEEVADRVQAAIQAGIDYEASLFGGENKSCGFGVNTAIVTRDGAAMR